MPVIECSCGMVMSVSAAEPRNSCIRCGSNEFGELERRKPLANLFARSAFAPSTTSGKSSPMSLLAMTGRLLSIEGG